MNLFIIGNGFDLAHGMPTSYEDFHQYLLAEHPDADENRFYVPDIVIDQDGAEVQCENDIVSLLCFLLNEAGGEKWSDLEKCLGEIDLISCFDDLPELTDKDGDRDLIHESQNNEDRAHALQLAVPRITQLLADWIETVALPQKPLQVFSKMIDPEEDIFLTFNYTETLESVYGCKNVVHIHGKIGEKLFFGHDCHFDYSENNSAIPWGASDGLAATHESLRKNVQDNIENNLDFFHNLGHIETIVSFGFSFSPIDIPYVQKICTVIRHPNVIWRVNSYNSEEVSRHVNAIQKCGFLGGIEKYST